MAALDRRRWLQLSSLGVLSAGSLAAPRLARAGADAGFLPPRGKRIRSCILIFHYGGPSQLETFDPKPQAPAEARGEYQAIDTAAAGIQISEHLPLTARLMDRVALVRTMHHPMRNHNAAAAEMLTGRTPAGGDQELLADESRSYPTLGSAVNYGLQSGSHVLPYVALPYTMYNVVQLPGQTPGILGGAYDRFQVQGDPNSPDFRVSALEAPGARGQTQIQAREELLRNLDGRSFEGTVSRMHTYQERALQLIASDIVRRGFEIGDERPEMRERYGRNLLGQSALLARRLVESGVNFVSVFNGQHNGQEANWDSHTNLFVRHRQLLPPADQAYSALLEDLEQRGLLDTTLVVWLSEFGRTPKINKSAGRDHWPDCYTVALAGGGVRGGSVHGASDKIAAYPDRDPVSPADLAATIFWRFGIEPEREFHDPTGRPFRLADGQPLYSLFG
ncbi:MAG: DUF1501 domain-containing protein [Planctomycetaceae bacterium]|nr:DUF1501 domain-containing protein [Planctomycetaceae bacterium]